MSAIHDQLVASLALESQREQRYGIFDGMDYETYRAIDAVNYSSLKHMRRSALSYLWHQGNPQPPTLAMQLGTHTHRMILEPDTAGDFAIWGECEGQNVRRGKVWDQFQAECALSGKQVITRDERDAMVAMAKAVRTSSLAWHYLEGGRSEVVLVWRDPKFNCDCKARLDKLKRIGGRAVIADLKTTRDCRPFRFGNEAYRLGYHLQLAMYCEGFRVLTGETPEMVEIAVESKAPHELAVYSISEDVLWKGREDYERLMKMRAESERTGVWPPAVEALTDLTLPSYAYGSAEEDFNLNELAE